MSEEIKTSKFLSAIKKHAEKDKCDILKEIEEYREIELNRAKEQAIFDAYAMIQKEITDKKAKTIREISKKEQESKKSLYFYRIELLNQIRDDVIRKLKDYHASSDYLDYLKKSALEAKSVVLENDSVVYISKIDLAYNDNIKEILINTSFVEDDSISLGGFKVYIPNTKMIIDQTFDTKLNEEINNFINKALLKVV